MKRLVTFTAALAVAAPLLAQQPAPAPAPATASTPAPAPASSDVKPAAPPKVLTAAPAAEDSPLVAAAKRTKRTGKKVPVITNDNLSKAETSNAHITTTTNQRSIDIPEDPRIEEARKAEARQKALKEREARVAKDAAKTDQVFREKMERVAAHQEEAGPYSDDPAANEKILEELQKQHEAAKQEKAARDKAAAQNPPPQQDEDDAAPPPQPKPPL